MAGLKCRAKRGEEQSEKYWKEYWYETIDKICRDRKKTFGKVAGLQVLSPKMKVLLES